MPRGRKTPPAPPENITEIPIDEELKEAYLTYSMSVIVSRALPDVRDGLKPSQRRVLIAMNDLGLSPASKFRKCAKIAGDTSGNYHPHGEQVIYPTLVRMAQDFQMRYCLVQGQGNFGSIDGDPPAAMRYTEARLTPFATYMLDELEFDTVNFVPNYDETRTEPVVLPSKFPNIICNGTSGIAVGMATSIPPHNLGEVIDALIKLIHEPEVSIEQLMEFIKGPDFPTGAIICGKKRVLEAYQTGRQTIILRAKIHFEKAKDGSKFLVVSEIPYAQSKSKIIEDIADRVKNEDIRGIVDIRDESDREGIRVVIEIDPTQDPEFIKQQLYNKTPLQTSFSVILLALDNGRPKLMNLKEMLQLYLQHRKEVVIRRTKFLLEKAQRQEHITDGLLKAINFIDQIIAIIRKAESPEEAREQLIKRFDFTHLQADAILRLTLQRLTRLESEKLKAELENLRKQIADYKAILADEKMVMMTIQQELLELKQKFADQRKTEIIDIEPEEIQKEELIPEQDVVVLLTEQGYIKSIALDGLRLSKVRAKPVLCMDVREDDRVICVLSGSTHDFGLFFSDKGRMFWCRLYEIPLLAKATRGKPLNAIFKIDEDEKITAALPVRNFEQGHLFLVTATGIAKKGELASYRTTYRCINAIDLEVGDYVAGAFVTSGRDEIMIGTADGSVIRFVEDEVRDMGRQAAGVKGIDVAKGDQVVCLSAVKRRTDVFTVSEYGFAKRSYVPDFRRQSRGGSGITAAKINEKTGRLVALKCVREADEIIIATCRGYVTRIRAYDVDLRDRYTMGERVLELESGDRVASIWFLRE